MLNLPLLHCTNCRESKYWNETDEKRMILRMPLGNGRYTILCGMCKEPLKIMEKAESDLFIKTYGALPVEEPIRAMPAQAPVSPFSNSNATPAAPISKPKPEPEPKVNTVAIRSQLEEQMKSIAKQLEQLKEMEKGE
jgi:hypothetical protein